MPTHSSLWRGMIPAKRWLRSLFGGLVFWLFCCSQHTSITGASAISLFIRSSLGSRRTAIRHAMTRSTSKPQLAVAFTTLLRFLFLCLLLPGAIQHARAAPESAPPAIRWVVEMERVPELKWPHADAKDYAEDRQQMMKAWQEISAAVQQQLTAAEVIRLCKWARLQMKSYTEVPSLERPDFQLLAASAGEKQLVFEATLQVLPTHSPLVTRWLKLLVVYDQRRRVISQVIMTIRGELQE